MSKKVLLSGIQPTHQLHLGNYLGAIRNWIELQEKYENYFLIVDSHAITLRQDPQVLRENCLSLAAVILASGIDPKKSHLFIQSQVPEHAELAWVITCHTTMGELSRMTQFKDKSASSDAEKPIPTGLFAYPALMAADILLYQTDLVPVGQDQKQHLELTRDVAERMNGLYGKNLFKVPEPYIQKIGGRVMDLQDPTKKMSKSSPHPKGTIFLLEDNKSWEKKIKSAVTDSGSEISDEDSKPGVQNLLQIQAALTGQSIPSIVKSYQGKQYGHLKVETAEIVIEKLSPLREKALELLKDRGELIRILSDGALRSRAVAQKTKTKVYDALGFVGVC